MTGPTGFIGSAILRLALRRGHEVAGLFRPRKLPPPDLAGHHHLVMIAGTLADAPWKRIESFQPEVCVHTAWITAPGVYLESPDNGLYFNWSLDFLTKVAPMGLRHVIGLGTCIEYRIGDEALSEDRTPLAPASPYARWKHQLHLALQQAAAANRFSLCWARVFYPYGVGEHPLRLCSSLVQRLERNEPVVLKTPDSTKDYIYIDDLAAAVVTVVEKRFSGAVNLGTGTGVSVREIAETAQSLLHKSGLVAPANPPAEDSLAYVVADATRLRGLGWMPACDLRGGLQKLIAAIAPG